MNKLILLIIGFILIINPSSAYTINEKLNEYDFNKWRINITFDNVNERNDIFSKINIQKVENIKNFSFINVYGLTYIAYGSLKNYNIKYNRICDNCSSWYLNGSWETTEVFNISNNCLECLVNISTTYNKSDRYYNISTGTDLPHWNQTVNNVWVNLTGNESQVGKAINNSNYYSSKSNGTTTFISYEDFEGQNIGDIPYGWSGGVITGTGFNGNRSMTTNGLWKSRQLPFPINLTNKEIIIHLNRSGSVISFFETSNTSSSSDGHILSGIDNAGSYPLLYYNGDYTYGTNSINQRYYKIKLKNFTSGKVDLEFWDTITNNLDWNPKNVNLWHNNNTFEYELANTGTNSFLDLIIVRKNILPEPIAIYNSTLIYINITSWNNDLTNNQSLILSNNSYSNISINFNITTNIVPSWYLWEINNINQSQNWDNLSYIFSSSGNYTINLTVYDSSTGVYNYKNWTFNFTKLSDELIKPTLHNHSETTSSVILNSSFNSTYKYYWFFYKVNTSSDYILWVNQSNNETILTSLTSGEIYDSFVRVFNTSNQSMDSDIITFQILATSEDIALLIQKVNDLQADVTAMNNSIQTARKPIAPQTPGFTSIITIISITLYKLNRKKKWK